MFTILGGDGKEYGPVTAEQIRAWIAAGRANLDTKAKVAGSSDDWKHLGELPEFNGSPLPPPLSLGDPTPFAPIAANTALADRGVRLLAVLLDSLIGGVCALPGFFLLGTSFVHAVIAMNQGQQPDFSNIDTGQFLLGMAVLGTAVFALVIVQLVMLATRGQTIGKRILGIRIVRHGNGAPAGFVHAWLLRALVPGIIGLIPVVGPLFSLVDVCFIFRDDRRCIHDLMADTDVVKV